MKKIYCVELSAGPGFSSVLVFRDPWAGTPYEIVTPLRLARARRMQDALIARRIEETK